MSELASVIFIKLIKSNSYLHTAVLIVRGEGVDWDKGKDKDTLLTEKIV